MKESNIKKRKILIIVIIAVLALAVIGSSYAYFGVHYSGGYKADINATTNTTDSLMFNADDPIEILADYDNFGEEGTDLVGVNTATATLRPNNKTNEAKATYNVFFIIEDNNFVYSTDDNLPEIVIEVTDPNGNKKEVTGLNSLSNYVYDITTREGGFLVASDYEIAVTDKDIVDGRIEKNDTWKIEVKLINLETDQEDNTGKTLNCRLYLTQDKLSSFTPPKINTMNILNVTYSSIETSLNVTEGTEKIDKYYFAYQKVGEDGELKYVETDEPNFTYEGLEDNTDYRLYSYVKDVQGLPSRVYSTDVKTVLYNRPNIVDVKYTNTLESITVNVDVTKEPQETLTYWYSINDDEYVSSPNNTYTFPNLKDTTTYKIKIKVSDSKGYYSSEYINTSAETERYILPNITSVYSYATHNTIDLEITATAGHGLVHGNYPVTEYWYQIDDGDWIKASGNKINLTNLTKNTTYNFNFKVKDSYGKESVIFEKAVTTEKFVPPTLEASVPVDSITDNSFTVNAVVTPGDGTVTKYMYSKDGGSNWVTVESSSSTDSYTFLDLTSGSTFHVMVKIIDSNNIESNVISIANITTLNSFVNNTTDYTASYNGSSHYLNIRVSPSSSVTYYYSTTTPLTKNNYKDSGSTSSVSRTEIGTTTVYWCVEKANYAIYCSSNTITITKGVFRNYSSDYNAYYDGEAHSFYLSVSPSSGTTFYYSTTTELTSSNYTSGTTTMPTRTEIGSTKVYWCAVKDKYTTYCSSNNIIVTTGVFTNYSSDYNAYYDGVAHSFNLNISPTSGTTVYYSTSQLTESNYTSGSTNPITRSAIGTTKVYWCAVKKGYTTLCSSNNITISTGVFSNYSSDYDNYYDGAAHSFYLDVSPSSGTTFYYSTSIQLTASTYTRGTTTMPTYVGPGTTTVYWCAVRTGYTTYCSNNKIIIAPLTFSDYSYDYDAYYDGAAHTFDLDIRPSSGTTVYYSTSTKLTASNYASYGTTTAPTRSAIGTTPVYWCAVKTGYTTYCSTNNIIINARTFTNNSSNYNGSYDGAAHSANISVNPSSGTTIYYSTSLQLDASNYTRGSTTVPTRSAVGTSTVYWCAVKSGYTTLCSNNSITINKANPTFTVPSSVTIDYTETTKSITVTKTGDGTISCVSASTGNATGNYARCSVSGTTVTFTKVAAGTENFTIKLSGTTNYNAGTDRTTRVTVRKASFVNNSSNVVATYDGNAKTFTPSVSPTPTSIYYSTSTPLTASNYSTSGSTSGAHSRTVGGVTTVYWCAVKSGYDTLCSSNSITINKLEPTFTFNWSSYTMMDEYYSSWFEYSYVGDGTVVCSPSSGTYANCSVDQTNKRITFTKKAAGTQTFSIYATEGTNYKATSVKSFTLTVQVSTLANRVMNLYTGQGNNSLYYHSTSLANSAGDNSYRYYGANPNNYVCFGDTNSNCNNGDLYRIIGVFGNQVKLIKADFASRALLGSRYDYDRSTTPSSNYKGSLSSIPRYYYNLDNADDATHGDNYWDGSSLSENALNGLVLDYYGSSWKRLISNGSWKLYKTNNIDRTPQVMADFELNYNTSSGLKVGLMYASDYGFGVPQSYWTRSLMLFNNYTSYNWLYMGDDEMLITAYKDSSNNKVLFIDQSGFVDYAYSDYGFGVRPSFYLYSDTICLYGDGYKATPFVLSP